MWTRCAWLAVPLSAAATAAVAAAAVAAAKYNKQAAGRIRLWWPHSWLDACCRAATETRTSAVGLTGADCVCQGAPVVPNAPPTCVQAYAC
jgi:hypothetical protein